MGIRITNIQKICGNDNQDLFNILCGGRDLSSRIDTADCIKNINSHISADSMSQDARSHFLDRLLKVFSQSQTDLSLEQNREHLRKEFQKITGAPLLEGPANTITHVASASPALHSAFPFALKARQTKEKEWQATAHSLRECYTTASRINKDAPCALTVKECMIKKLERALLHISILAGRKVDNAELSEHARRIYSRGNKPSDELKEILAVYDLQDKNHVISAHFSGCDELNDASLSDHYKNLQNSCDKIRILCDSSATEILSPDLVKECEYFLKEAFKNPAYRLLCIDEENPCVKFLHKIALAVYAEPKIAPAYLSFTQEIPTQNTLHEQIQAFQSTIVDRKPPYRDPNIFSSELMRIGSIGSEHCISHECHVEILRLIGPGQARHDEEPNPILLLVLQSIENEICRAINDNTPAPTIGMIMVNMQDPTNPKEMQSSTRLMQLGDCYPLSLRVATISAYCPFSDNSLTNKTAIDCIQALTADDNFSLPQKTPRKYIFPPSERDFFQRRIPEIVKRADSITQNPVAFYELLKLALWTTFEVRALQSLQQQVPISTTAKVLALTACHSGVDRGGSSYATRIAALSKDETSQKSAPHLWFGRAAATWQRMPDHTDRVITLSEKVPLSSTHKFLQDVVTQGSDGTVRDLAFQIESMHI